MAAAISQLAHAGLGPVESASESSKELGAYYTDSIVAAFLVQWALVSGRERVLDPCFGGGVFLNAARDRLRALGGDPTAQIYGIELDVRAYQDFLGQWDGGRDRTHLIHASFFDVHVGELPPIDVVVGNPPFIRYQRFSGAMRQSALERAREAGVTVSSLTSSWAPFLVHAVQFLMPGGRLAMVAPAELAHASYARPVLEHLCRSFRQIRILTFRQRLFAKLSEDTVLVLAEGRGERFEALRVLDLSGLAALPPLTRDAAPLPDGDMVDVSAILQGRQRLLHCLLPAQTLDLYHALRADPRVRTLGEMADVGIGYVTGDNDFFHVDLQTINAYRLPACFLRRAVRRGPDLEGLRFTYEDWNALHYLGFANMLLYVVPGADLPAELRAYLDLGSSRGVPKRYKCAVRDPWYCVPNVYGADAFLTYMSGAVPKLVANAAGAVAPNTLHVVRLRPSCPTDALGLATYWQTSLTALSCELEGHSLGGGMLKLEPTEARRVAIALPEVPPASIAGLAEELDRLLRAGKHDVARKRADAVLLRRGLGLSEADVRALYDGWRSLQARRYHR